MRERERERERRIPLRFIPPMWAYPVLQQTRVCADSTEEDKDIETAESPAPETVDLDQPGHVVTLVLVE